MCTYIYAVSLLYVAIGQAQIIPGMNFVNKLSVFTRFFATAVKPAYTVRGATAVMPAYKSATITTMAIQEGWHVGPYDFPIFLSSIQRATMHIRVSYRGNGRRNVKYRTARNLFNEMIFLEAVP